MPAFAQSHSNAINFNTVIIDGRAIPLSHDIIISDGYIIFPVRSLFGALGFAVEWNDDARTVTLTRSSDVIIIPISGDNFTINGQPHPIESPAQIINDRTFAPAGNLLSAIGYGWGLDFSISTTETIREDEIARDNALAAVFLNLVSQEAIKNLTDIVNLSQDEIADAIEDIAARYSGLLEHSSSFVDADFFVVIWDEDGTVMYSTLSQESVNIVSLFFAAGEFLPHEAEIYFYRDWQIVVGFNHALNTRGFDITPLYQTHTVATGDTLSSIARLYFGSSHYDVINLILAANDITSNDALFVGQVLIIPTSADR